MATVQFYQVNGQTPGDIDAVLPFLLGKICATGQRVVIRCPSLERRDRLNDWLWRENPTSFLPHGVAEDGQSEHQPIFLTTDTSNPNEATILLTLGGTLGETPDAQDLNTYTKVLDVFDNSEHQTTAARRRWKALKEQQATLAYFAQSEQGWQKKG